MPTTEFCVYNETRESLLSAEVTVTDTNSEPLKMVKVLIEGPGPNSEDGLWLNPIKSMPMVPRLTPYDLVYLDKEGRVVHSIELVPDDEAPRFDGRAASALVLPFRTFSASRAVPGDHVVLRPTERVNESSMPDTVKTDPIKADLAPVPQIGAAAAEPSAGLVFVPPSQYPAFTFRPKSAFQPTESDAAASVAGKKESGIVRLLRSIARMRVNISISITTKSSASVATTVPQAASSARPSMPQ